jgi:tripartite ATP-independent transporter DctM subunit
MTNSQPETPGVPNGVTSLPGLFRYLENLVISLVLGIMVVLPLAEIVLRRTLSTGISNSSGIVQHMVLIVGMLGGAVAARDDRLLSLSTFSTFLTGRWKTAAHVFTNAVACAVAFFLCVAGAQYSASASQEGNTLAYGVPIWAIKYILPLGFALIALRLIMHASTTVRGRAIATLIACAIVAAGTHPFASPGSLELPALGLLLVAIALGAPIFTALGGAALILFWAQDTPIASISISHYEMAVNPSLPAIPLFTLAGYFLAEGGASKRLVSVFRALVGQFRGGTAIVTVLVCAFFTTFTGASGVTILALGGLLMPVLVASRYSERDSLGLLTAAGSLGLLFPPCLPPILYSIVSTTAGSRVSLEQIFLGGLLPGVLLVGLMSWWGFLKAPKTAEARERFVPRRAATAVWEAKWELLLPVVALLALFGGFATPVEAAAITALYAFVVETFIYRDLELTKQVPRVMTECGLLVGGVLLILGVAMGFTNYLVDAQVPDNAAAWVQASIHSPWVFLLALNGFLLIVGCLMDIYSAIIVVVPLIVPIGRAFGIDPVHLGIVFLANMELGYLTPPVGMNLFLSSYRFSKPMPEVVRAVLPMLAVLLAGVLMITYIPWLTTWLPGYLR